MIAEEIHRITQALPAGVRLVAVSKYHPAEAIREAYAAGQRVFGESHAQELQAKHTGLSDLEGLEWHFIGHLQTNKVKYIAPYVHLVHAVDSHRLLAEIDKQAKKVGRVIPCLLQLHVAEEETKFGFTPDEARDYLEAGAWRQLSGVRIAGVMCMATNTDDTARIRSDFRRARCFFEEARRDFFPADDHFRELSMGMTDDWHIAIDEGSTLIRIGTQIFGQRQY
ncbi:MAG: YggS family pyridoxal phosphate-dependent enzyme [Bacteroidaceae bacterium]|nr:YggS family pyridoxal phosphate-dependent enzyme [Bacteroidaceae bacterium]